jgi:hypothetical protein
MAVYKIFPSKDATMYSMYPTMNTGLDEIVESSLTSIAPTDPNPQVSRFLIKFDQSNIENVMTNLVNGYEWQANLRCFVAITTGLDLNTTVDIWAVSGSWDMGTGKYLDQPLTTDGVSWQYQTYDTDYVWNVLSPGPNVTSDYNTNYAPLGGGTWYNQIVSESTNTYLSSSQVYSYAQDKDLNVDVTNIVDVWLSGSVSYYESPAAIVNNITSSIPVVNEGFLVKQQLEWVYSNNYQPEIKFFSIDTHTIFPPVLEIKWDDFTYNTGSLPVLDTLPATIALAQNPGTFYTSSINRFRVNSRPEYPIRVWQTSSVYLNNYALPTASYWALKDLDTNEYVIDFDTTYTKLSCDSSGSYFDMHMNGLEPERYYQIIFKTNIDGSTLVFDNEYYFKIVN